MGSVDPEEGSMLMTDINGGNRSKQRAAAWQTKYYFKSCLPR